MLPLSIVLSVLVAIIAILTLWLGLPGFRKWRLFKEIPMPKYVPHHWLLGHVPALMKRNEALLMKIVREINELGKKHPGILKFHVGPIVNVTIVHSKHVHLFLKEPKSNIYDMLLPWLGEGLLIAEGSKWFRNRRLLTPAFHYSILKNYVSIYNSCVSILLDGWYKSAQEGKSVLVFKTICSMSLDIIQQCAFSFKSNCQDEKTQHPYARSCNEIIQHISNRGLNPIYRINWIYWCTAHGRKMKKLCKLVHDHAEGVIAERKAVLAALDEERVSDVQGKTKTKKKLDFLDILLMARDEEGNGMSDLEIRNEVDTFMFEGHDTTTSGMSWTLYCLAQHPQHQDKIREEVRSVLKGREWLEYEDLKHLSYTMWCIKEAMRLYPPVFNFFRKTTKEIRVGEYVLPKGTNVTIASYYIHHNEDIWENPMEYNPLRFQPSNMEKHGPYDYIPFSAGSRNCIGQNFAMNEMKVVIGTIINHFQLRLDSHHQVDLLPTVVLRTRTDIKIYLKELIV